MRVLMFGWEFPPFKSGGLGTACKGMTTALARKGTEIVFVLPRTLEGNKPMHVQQGLDVWPASGRRVPRITQETRRDTRLHTLWQESLFSLGLPRDVSEEEWWERIRVCHVDSPLRPYLTSRSYEQEISELERRLGMRREDPGFRSVLFSRREEETSTSVRNVESEDCLELHGGYGPDLMAEVWRYARAAAAIALETDFDVIHVHDWMTYPAGILVKQLTGKPLVAHAHALEHDRSGDNINAAIANLERMGMEAADLVVAVSAYTRQEIMEFYGIPGDKIEVIHNAVERSDIDHAYPIPALCKKEKRVLFMGRVTYQKGPDYFVEAARLVLDRLPNTRFIMAGSGDMLPNMVRRVAQLRMGSRFHFTGFLRNRDVDRMYAMSDLYVMPSVSEPFGIAPLEAMACDVPVLVSRQSGVVEVLRNAIKVDFWDVREMANKICALLSYPVLAAEEVRNCREELKNIRWENAAVKLRAAYDRLIAGRR